MRRLSWIAGTLVLATLARPARAEDGDGTPQKAAPKLPPVLARLLNGTPEDFIKQFDRNKDGVLTPNELPPRLAPLFQKVDANGDGKLDQDEVAQLLQIMRRRFGMDANKKKAALAKDSEGERMLTRILEQMDTNKDGKISRAEAKGAIAQNFDRIDTNQDGVLDKDEMRRSIRQFLAARKSNPEAATKAGPAGGLDFDALDRDADGRLTREEVKGTAIADHFDEIDTNKDGKIDPKEWAAYQKKQVEKKTDKVRD